MTTRLATTLLFVLATAAAVPCFPARARADDRPALTFYISPGGNDAWSGTAAEPNADRTDGPFATPAKARDAVRAARQRGKAGGAATVYLRGGTYSLAQPLALTPQDSGTAAGPVTFAAYKDEAPVLSGGRRLGPWRGGAVGGREVWAAELPKGVEAGQVRELWVGGRRRARARWPDKGYLTVVKPGKRPENEPKGQGPDWTRGVAGVYVREGDLKEWPALAGAECVVMSRWVESRVPVERVDPKERLLTFGKQTVFELQPDDLYWLEGAADFLDAPGEWYADAKAGVVHYLPLPGEKMDAIDAVVPALTSVLRLEGDPAAGKSVEHVAFRGVTFAHCRADVFDKPNAPSGFAQAAVKVGAAVEAVGARQCVFDHCAVAHVGGYAVQLGRGCQQDRFDHCTLTDLGAGGVKIGETQSRPDPRDQAFGNQVVDTRITDGDRIFPSAVGVWIGQSYDNLLSHNEIADLYYSAVSIGWTWGYGPTLARGNVMEHNDIHHIGKRADGDGPILSDMGGVYTLGVQPGTAIRHNRFHDIAALKYGGWGIYFDEGSTGIVAEDNVVYRTTHGGLHQHYGRDNVFRNNILAFGRDWQVQRTRPEPHRSFSFERNVVYWDAGVAVGGGGWSGPQAFNVTFDHNCYWAFGSGQLTFGGRDWAAWRMQGMDADSVVADPLFVDSAKDDFRLRPESPAVKAGFVPFDLSGYGPR